MRTPFPRKRGGGGRATGGSGGHATGGGGEGTTGRCEGLRRAETGRRANLGWAQTGERPERGGEEGGGPHTVAHRRGERGTVASVSTSINATSAPSCPLFASSLLCSAPLRLLSSFPHSASPRSRPPPLRPAPF